jgi:hypothetical protein
MGTEAQCTRCGRAIIPGRTGKPEDADAVEIRLVRIKMDGEVEAQGGNEQRTLAGKGKVAADGRRETSGKMSGQKTGVWANREGSVDPHVSLTSSDESHKLICCQCLHVLLPILFPPHPQPLRVTIGLEDVRLIRGISPAVLATCGAGHMEVEQADGDTLLVHFYSECGKVESYTVGRAGDLVRIPGQRPAGTSIGKEG